MSLRARAARKAFARGAAPLFSGRMTPNDSPPAPVAPPPPSLWRLYAVFFNIGAFSFGGGSGVFSKFLFSAYSLRAITVVNYMWLRWGNLEESQPPNGLRRTTQIAAQYR